jgi:hypothetical protein
MKTHGLPEKFWLVVSPSPNSTFVDICFDCDFEGFARQIRGGLDEAKIIGIFAEANVAAETAKHVLHLAEEFHRTPGVRIYKSPWPEWFATQESLMGVMICNRATDEKQLVEPPKEWGIKWAWNFVEDGSGIVIRRTA